MLLWDTFFSSRSTLLRNKMTEMFSNIMLFTIVWKMFRDSWTLLVFLSSSRTWSYSEVEAMKRILVTESKHWNHFCLWVLWPPTSTKRKGTLQIFIRKSRYWKGSRDHQPVYLYSRLNHPLCCLPTVENVLKGWHVVQGGNSINVIQKILDRVRQLKLVSPNMIKGAFSMTLWHHKESTVLYLWKARWMPLSDHRLLSML